MAIPADIVRTQLVFTTDHGVEIAETGWHAQRKHTIGAPVSWASDVAALASATLDKIIAHKDDLSFPLGGCSLNVVKCFHLDAATGHTLDEGMAAPDPALTWGGNIAPLPVTVPLHLYGYDPTRFDPLRRSKRGRMSLGPVDTSKLGAEGLITPTVATNIVNSWGVFLNDINGMHIGDSGVAGDQDSMTLGVLSKLKSSFYPVTHIGVGNHYGWVASRQGKVKSAYSYTQINQS